VALAANGRDVCPQASDECVTECARRLMKMMAEDKLVLDDDGHIFGQYQQYLAWEEQRIGYVFIKWVHNNRYNPERCDEVHISADPRTAGDFAEFPEDAELAGFDRSDRMFVAVARAHPSHPPILNAVDTDWWLFRDALARNGVHVEFLCPQDVTEMARRHEARN